MLKIAPLGGLGEIGLNAMALEHGASRVLIDCGLAFPRGALPGVEVLLPDFTHLTRAPERLQGILLTHAHEDHVGALPVLLRELDRPVPVYGAPFALANARHRLEEARLDAELIPVHPGERFRLGELELEAFTVTHSVPDALGVVVRSQSATVIHTGDFKLDESPIDGKHTQLERLREIGDEGVDLLLSDSTNAGSHGHTPSEATVAKAFERVIGQAKGRVVVAMFGSHVLRARHLAELCQRLGRRLCVLGRSLERNLDAAKALKLLPTHDGLFASPEEAAELPGEKVVIICTGAQAEERSALSSMLSNEPRTLAIEPTDTVILSSRTIPGNEPQVAMLLDKLYARGATVVWPGNTPDVHVSGHASRDDLREMMRVVRPKALTPIHGELHHLHRHLELGREHGLPGSGLVLATDGDVIAVNKEGAGLDGRVMVGQHLAKRDGFVRTTWEAVQERKALAEGGIVVCAIALDSRTGGLMGGPRLTGRGLTEAELRALPHAEGDVKASYLETPSLSRLDQPFSEEMLTFAVRAALKARFGRKVLVMPVVVKL